MTTKKMSPLKFLATLHREMKEPTQVVPKSKTVMTITEGVTSDKKEIAEVKPEAAKMKVIEPEVLKPEVLKTAVLPALNIRDFSFVFNLNFNWDPQVIENVVEKSAKIMTGLAAGAAVLGTALVFKKNTREIRPSLKVFLPDLKKTKIPKDPRSKLA